jgi:hypothetical protein
MNVEAILRQALKDLVRREELGRAISRLHIQTKSQPTPARIHIWTD